MNKIKPLHNRVLVKRFKSEKSRGGILLPEAAQEKPKEGEVVAVGPGARDEDGALRPMLVKVKDRVLFSSYSASDIKDEQSGEELMLMSEDDILAILD